MSHCAKPLSGLGGSEVPPPATPGDAGALDPLCSRRQSHPPPKGSRTSPEVLLTRCSLRYVSQQLHRLLHLRTTHPGNPTKQMMDGRLHGSQTPPAHPQPVHKHPASNHSTSELRSSSPRAPRRPPWSQPYLGGGVNRRLWGVDDEVAEGEAKPPLRALPQHHCLRTHPGEGPLRGHVGVWGRPIPPARCWL